MRVLETEGATTYSMGKKNKHKLRKSKENEMSDSSEEVTGRGCVHVSKAVNFNSMKKGLAKLSFGECTSCAKELAKKGDHRLAIDHLEGATSGDFIEEVEPVIWACLQCGHQGCGRNSQEKHALKHYQTPRSSQHNVVINTSTWTAWCYECDDELHPEKYKKVSECMEHIKKVACVPLPDTGQCRNSGSNGGPSSSSDAGNNKLRPSSGKGTPSPGCQKVKGLSNLGNTCFFNAVMQNLIQTYSLENLLGERKKTQNLKLHGHPFVDNMDSSSSSSDEGDREGPKDVPAIEINISDPGPLTQALVVFLHDNNTRSSTVNPSALFGQVCKKAPRFKGMQQQDSHELLRYLLDNMKTEEMKRGQSGILKHFKLSENSNPKKVDDDTKFKVKAYGSEVKHTFVECLFGGQLISTVECEECKYISQILEPFLDLSLPVTEEKPQRPNQAYCGKKKEEIGEIKEEQPSSREGTARDEKISKYQQKKNKTKKKQNSRKSGSKNKVAPSEEGGKVEDDQGDKEEDVEDKEEEEGDEKTPDNDERCYASDADVEDNLESDTSRCYTKTNSDSINSAIEDLPQNGIDTDNQQTSSLNSSQCASFSVETTIDNCSGLSCSNNRTLDNNGPNENGLSSSAVEANDISVTFNIVNGGLEEDANKVANCDASFTLPAPLLVNGEDKNLNNDKFKLGDSSKSIGIPNGDYSHMNGCLENDVGNDSDAIKDGTEFKVVKSESFQNRDSMDGQLTDITSGVSTLSLGEKSSPSSDLSQMTLNGEVDAVKENGVGSVNNHTAAATPEEKSPVGVKTEGVSSHESGSMHRTSSVSSPQAPKQKSWKDLQKDGRRKSISTLSDRYHPSSGECSIESCLHQFTAAELLTGNNKFGCKNCTKLKYRNHPSKEKKEMVYSNANKQYLIFQPPAVLTLHLKRFEQVGFSSRKVNRHVDFPFVLDIAPYCSSLTQGIKPGQKKILYSLYGVVEHSGRLTSGHYTAYVKVRPNIGTLNNYLNKHNVTLKEYLHKYAQNVMKDDPNNREPIEDINTEKLVPPGRWYHISDSRVNEVTEASVERAQAYLLFYERIY